MNRSCISTVKRHDHSKIVSREVLPKKSHIPTFQNKNQKIIFEILRELGPTTRTEIVERTGIPRTTVYDALTKLVSMEWVTRETVSPGKGKKGRSKAIYSLKAKLTPFSTLDKIASPKSITLGFFISSFADVGPIPLVSFGMEILNEEKSSIEAFLNRQAVFYQVALGQGDLPSTGLFGPLPVREHPELLAMAFGFYATDQNSMDLRRKNGISFGVLVIIFTKNDENVLPPRVTLEKTLSRLFNSVEDMEDVDRMFLLTANMLIQREINLNYVS